MVKNKDKCNLKLPPNKFSVNRRSYMYEIKKAQTGFKIN